MDSERDNSLFEKPGTPSAPGIPTDRQAFVKREHPLLPPSEIIGRIRTLFLNAQFWKAT